MSSAVAFAVIGAVVGYSVAMWLGLVRWWANRPSFARYQFLLLPWASLAVVELGIPTLFERFLGIRLPPIILALVDPLCVATLIIGFSVSFLQWPKWAMPPWFRRLEEERRVIQGRLGSTAERLAEQGNAATSHPARWRRWRFVVMGAVISILVGTIVAGSLERQVDLPVILTSAFLSFIGGMAMFLEWRRNEASYRAGGWRW